MREGVGIATNNVAEYRGLILGLGRALQKGFKRIQVRGDSMLVCMQVCHFIGCPLIPYLYTVVFIF